MTHILPKVQLDGAGLATMIHQVAQAASPVMLTVEMSACPEDANDYERRLFYDMKHAMEVAMRDLNRASDKAFAFRDARRDRYDAGEIIRD